MRSQLSLLLLLLAAPAAASQTSPELEPAALQAHLQRFVDGAYGAAFERLGDEDDFDHGHLLRGADGRPVAILYHTQELAPRPKGPRNWIQWLDDGRVEDASRLKRSRYPDTGAWEQFRLSELPALEARRTVTDKMLDPRKLAIDPSRTEQWTFTRAECGGENLSVRLPGAETVCLALKRG